MLCIFIEKLHIQNKLISKFRSFGELEAFATKTMDAELLGKIRIVKSYHHNLPVILSKIQSKCVRDVRVAGRSSKIIIHLDKYSLSL